ASKAWTSHLPLAADLELEGAWRVEYSTATAQATSLFSMVSRRNCGRATTTTPSSAARLTLALPTPRSRQQRKLSHSHRNEDGQCAEKARALRFHSGAPRSYSVLRHIQGRAARIATP